MSGRPEYIPAYCRSCDLGFVESKYICALPSSQHGGEGITEKHMGRIILYGILIMLFKHQALRNAAT